MGDSTFLLRNRLSQARQNGSPLSDSDDEHSGGSPYRSPPLRPRPWKSARRSAAVGAIQILDGQHTPQNVALYSYLLGALAGGGVILGLRFTSSVWSPLGWFIAGLGTFHTWEYIPTAMYRPNALGLDSFLLDHSWQYKFAMSIGFVEFLVELYFFPWMKSWRWFNHLGLFLLIAGQIARTVAQIHAGHNFDHLIQEYKSNDHVLVKTGIYRILRHPSYTGFFYWGIGMQLVLSNPICMVGYAAGLWYFFWDRIAVEEETLVRFFGEEYVEYRKKTWVLIPGIR